MHNIYYDYIVQIYVYYIDYHIEYDHIL